MNKVVIKISQGNAVTVTALGKLIIHPLVANIIQYMSAKKYKNRLAHVKVTSRDKVGSFY